MHPEVPFNRFLLRLPHLLRLGPELATLVLRSVASSAGCHGHPFPAAPALLPVAARLLPRQRPLYRVDAHERRDTLAGGRIQGFAQRPSIAGDQLSLVTGPVDLDVEASASAALGAASPSPRSRCRPSVLGTRARSRPGNGRNGGPAEPLLASSQACGLPPLSRVSVHARG